MKKLSKNDYEILRVISVTGTTNSEKISKELGLSGKTVRNRLNYMKENNVFRKAIIIDPEFFGYSFRADFFLKVFKKDIEAVTDWLVAEHKHTLTYLGRHWGDDNISLQCVFKSGNEAEDFEKLLKGHKLINDYEISMVPAIFKDTNDWRPHQSNFNITPKGFKELKERRKLELNKKNA